MILLQKRLHFVMEMVYPYKVVKGQVIAKTPFIGYLSQLCFSAVGIIVTVVIFAAGVAIMMYVNKISKEINTMVEQRTA